MSGRLSNCIRCGNLFVSSGIAVCPQCMLHVEGEYRICADYLREHNMVNIYTLSEATGVSVKQITQFVREGRISVAETPNLGYPCEKCGASINKGRLCEKCAASFNKEIDKVSKGRYSGGGLDSSSNQNSAYYQIKDRFKK